MLGIEWLRPAAFVGSIVYALIGVVVFWVCFIIVDKITPYDLWAEIVEKQNRALGLVVPPCAWASRSSSPPPSTADEVLVSRAVPERARPSAA